MASTRPTTATARRVVTEATRCATELRSRVIGQEHVLLALIDEPDSLAAAMLGELGVYGSLGVLPSLISAGAGAQPSPEPTPRFRKALEEAEAEAAEQDRATTSADLVIGILRANIGVGFNLLRGAGVTLDDARAALAAVPLPHAELDDVAPANLRQ